MRTERAPTPDPVRFQPDKERLPQAGAVCQTIEAEGLTDYGLVYERVKNVGKEHKRLAFRIF